MCRGIKTSIDLQQINIAPWISLVQLAAQTALILQLAEIFD